MATFNDVLLGIARDLNDAEPGHEFTTWSKDQLSAWYQEGLCVGFYLNPTQFGKAQVVKLDPGTDQELCDCTILREVVGQTDAAGQLTTPLPRINNALSARWTKPACPARPSNPPKLTGYSFDPLVGNLLFVQPPVLPGQDVYLKVICFNLPQAMDDAAEVADCATNTAARQWVLFRAHMMDHDAASGASIAQVHAKMYFDLLKMKFDREIAMALAADPNPVAAARTMATALRR